MQAEAGFLHLVHLVAAQFGVLETVQQFGSRLHLLGQPKRLFGQRNAQQQQVRAIHALQQRQHFRRPVLIEKQIRIGGQQIAIGNAQRERLFEMHLRQHKVAEARRHFPQPGQYPKPLRWRGICSRVQCCPQAGVSRPGFARQGIQYAGAAHAYQRRSQFLQ